MLPLLLATILPANATPIDYGDLSGSGITLDWTITSSVSSFDESGVEIVFIDYNGVSQVTDSYLCDRYDWCWTGGDVFDGDVGDPNKALPTTVFSMDVATTVTGGSPKPTSGTSDVTVYQELDVFQYYTQSSPFLAYDWYAEQHLLSVKGYFTYSCSGGNCADEPYAASGMAVVTDYTGSAKFDGYWETSSTHGGPSGLLLAGEFGVWSED